MLARIAVVPHPPLLVPELAAGAAHELDDLRAACTAATAAVARSCAAWFAVAAVPAGATVAPAGTFAGYGVDVPVVLDPTAGAPPDPDLALPLLVAGWLRGAVPGEPPPLRAWSVPRGTPVDGCVEAGHRLADAAGAARHPVGLLVLGDGTAARTARAPGGLDPRAAAFDEAVAAALAAADPPSLLALDPALADALHVAGREAWQVGAAAALASGAGWRGELLHTGAPYGVGYSVALWERA